MWRALKTIRSAWTCLKLFTHFLGLSSLNAGWKWLLCLVRFRLMLRRNRVFTDRTHLFDTGIRWWINFQEIQIQTRRHCDPNRLHWEGHCGQQSDRLLKLTSLLQVSLRRSSPVVIVFRVCVELIGVVQDRPVQSPPFISKGNLLRKAFRYPTDIDFRSNPTPQTLIFAVILPHRHWFSE